jgi:hypothetical protein
MDFFGFWAFNTAGKNVTKVGIYALPPRGGPQKVTFLRNYRFLLIYAIGLFDHYSWLRQFIATQFHTYTFFYKILY